MKQSLLGVIAFTLLSSSVAYAQLVFADDFDTYTPGPLGSQGGWSSEDVVGSSAIDISTAQFQTSPQSLLISDADNSSRPEARRDLGSNTTFGSFAFHIRESPDTAGTDIWRTDFFDTGSFSSNFSVVRGGSAFNLQAGATVLDTISIASTSYDTADWNEFQIDFNEATGLAAVYLNGESTAILTANSDSTLWSIGRLELAAGFNSGADDAVFFDTLSLNAIPEPTVASGLMAAMGMAFWMRRKKAKAQS